jgi:predicted Zn-dependent protease
MNDLEAAEGYLQLEMAEDALVELRNMPTREQNSERYKELLLATQMMLKHWNSAAATAQELCKMDGKEKSYFIHAAFCLHETGETLAALRQLLSGPKSLVNDSLYHYNLACYHAVLGNLTDARSCLDKSFKLDPELEKTASEDDDLKSLFVF